MKLIEADGKKMVQDAGIRIPDGRRFSFEELLSAEIVFPSIVKAQVLSGRRGKRGLVRRVASHDDIVQVVTEMQTVLGAEPNAGVLVEPFVEHASEWFVSLDIDRSAGAIRANISATGGMGVQSAHSMHLATEADVASLDVPPAIAETVRQLFVAFQKNDALIIELNPLALLHDGTAIALDAKIELDDQAAFRHPEWSALTVVQKLSPREQAYADLLASAGHRGTLGRYVELDGDIALLLSGGGASLVALDALNAAGGRAANYVEMSGNPDPESVRAAAAIVFSKPGIHAVWIAGSFANFTDIQSTVMAVLAAMDDAKLRVPVVIRRDGPNATIAHDEAIRWAEDRGVSLQFDRADVDLHASARTIVQIVNAL